MAWQDFCRIRYKQYRWLPESLVSFPDYHELARIMESDVGLEEVRTFPLTGGIAALHIGRKGTQPRVGKENTM